MKIAMVSEHANPLATPGSVDSGGQNVHVAALSEVLAARGHEVTVYTRRDSAKTPTRVRLCDGVDVVHLTAGPTERIPKDYLLPYMGALADELAASWAFDPPDVVHGHFWMSGLALLGAARSLPRDAPRPVYAQTFHALGSVKRRHQGSNDTSPPERKRLEPLVARRVDTVIATCPDERMELQLLGVDADRIDIAPCGVDPQVFSPEGPRVARGPNFKLLSVGRLVPRKGVENIIRALGILASGGMTDIELEVIGEGDAVGARDLERERLEAIASELGVSAHVHFRGQCARELMPSLLRSADAVVCTPWYEPFGIVPLESMACGTPVIVAAVGGLQSSVLDGVTGLHVPPRDPRALAEAIRRLRADEQLRQRCAVEGRERVLSGYSWASVAERTEAIYHARARLTRIQHTSAKATP